MEILNDQVARIPVYFGENGTGLVNVYLVRGEKIGLIDTGVAGSPERWIAPALTQIGLRLEDIDLILNTHGHSDHILPIRRGDEIAQTLRDSLEMSERIGSTVKAIMNERADIGLVDLAWAVLDQLRWVQPVQYHRELGAVPTQISAIMAHWMDERGIDPRTA